MEADYDLLLPQETGSERSVKSEHQVHARYEQDFPVYVPDRSHRNDIPVDKKLNRSGLVQNRVKFSRHFPQQRTIVAVVSDTHHFTAEFFQQTNTPVNVG